MRTSFKKKTTPIPISVHYLDLLSNNPFESATLFSDCFVSVFQPPITLLLLNSCKFSYNLPSNCYSTLDDILKALAALQTIISCGSDDISACLLYHCRNSLFFPIFFLFELYLDKSIFPSTRIISLIILYLKMWWPFPSDQLQSDFSATKHR